MSHNVSSQEECIGIQSKVSLAKSMVAKDNKLTNIVIWSSRDFIAVEVQSGKDAAKLCA